MILNNIKVLLEQYQQHMLRNQIHPGDKVSIVLKKDQRTGIQTIGIVKRILSPGTSHTRGIKVMLINGQVGRVQKIIQCNHI
jgi:uncharacterized repeat protein (TIGR03833 family)